MKPVGMHSGVLYWLVSFYLISKQRIYSHPADADSCMKEVTPVNVSSLDSVIIDYMRVISSIILDALCHINGLYLDSFFCKGPGGLEEILS